MRALHGEPRARLRRMGGAAGAYALQPEQGPSERELRERYYAAAYGKFSY